MAHQPLVFSFFMFLLLLLSVIVYGQNHDEVVSVQPLSTRYIVTNDRSEYTHHEAVRLANATLDIDITRVKLLSILIHRQMGYYDRSEYTHHEAVRLANATLDINITRVKLLSILIHRQMGYYDRSEYTHHEAVRLANATLDIDITRVKLLSILIHRQLGYYERFEFLPRPSVTVHPWRDTLVATMCRGESDDRRCWCKTNRQYGNGKGVLLELALLANLLLCLCLQFICSRVLVQQTPCGSNKYQFLRSITNGLTVCAVFCFQSASLKENPRPDTKMKEAFLPMRNGDAGNVTALFEKPWLACSQKMVNTLKTIDSNEKCCMTESPFQKSSLDYLFNFRRDQSFRQTCTACPASVSLASHFASGTYGQPGSSQQLQKEGVRLASFKDFPSSVPVSVIRLAQAGFYYTGERDEVRCFCCDVTHGGWQMCDKPSSVHVRISPNCPLVRGSDQTNIPLPSSISTPPISPNATSSIDNQFGSTSTAISTRVSAGVTEAILLPSLAPAGVTSSPHSAPPPVGASPSPSALSVSSTTASAEHGLLRHTIAHHSGISGYAVNSSATSFGQGNPLSFPPPAIAHESGISGYAVNSIATSFGQGNSLSLPPPAGPVDVGFAVCPGYSQLEARRRSFSTWVEDQGLPFVEELAAQGFYFAGGRVQCFFCGISLEEQTPRESVAEMHARWQPPCDFRRLIPRTATSNQAENGRRNDASREARSAHPTACYERPESHIVLQEGASWNGGGHYLHTVDVTSGTEDWVDNADRPLRPGGVDPQQNGQGDPRRITGVRYMHFHFGDRMQDENAGGSVRSPEERAEERTTIGHLIHRFGWGTHSSSGERHAESCYHCHVRPANVLLFNCHECVLCQVCINEVYICPRCGRPIYGFCVLNF